MDILIPFILLALGIALIIKGGDIFVTSSVLIAKHAGIPRVVIGGTLVSLATTAPELAVSATASLQGNPGLAVGNAVGSAICNIGLIIGILCILHPLDVRREDFCVPARMMLAAGIVLTILTIPLRLARPHGLLLIACALVYLIVDYWRHRRRVRPPSASPEASSDQPSWSLGKAVAYFALGALLVIAGSRLMSDNGVKLASMMGIPDMVIGLTLVAIGTSLPELVIAVTAVKKGVPELSLGNVVGANILNITLVTGVAGTIHPLSMTRNTQLYNFPAMLILFILLLVMARTDNKLTRKEGWVFILFYISYLGGLFILEMR